MDPQETLLGELPINISDPLSVAIAEFNSVHSEDPYHPDLRHYLSRILNLLPPNVNSIFFDERLSVSRETDFPEPEVWDSNDVLTYMDFLFDKQLGVVEDCITDYQERLYAMEIYSNQIHDLLTQLYSPYKQFDKPWEREIWENGLWNNIYETVFKLLDITPGNYNGLDLGEGLRVIKKEEVEEENILTAEQLYKIENILEFAWSKNDCTNNI